MAYVSFFPDLAMEGAPEIIGAFARQAAQAGVKRLVLLSGRGEPEAQRSEQELIAAGTEYTIVRCSWFAQNFSEAFMADAVLAGELALPAGPVPEPFVDVEDIAEVAAAALTDDRHVGEVYELTGPRALRFEEVAAELSAASGREIRFTRIPVEAFMAGMLEAGVPQDEADLVTWLFTHVLDGRNTRPAGRRPARARPRPARLRRVRPHDGRDGGVGMISPGQTIENPVTGERFTFTHTAASTDGELLAFDFALRPGGKVPVPHVHPIQTERFEVVEGEVRFRLGLQHLRRRPGRGRRGAAGRRARLRQRG